MCAHNCTLFSHSVLLHTLNAFIDSAAHSFGSGVGGGVGVIHKGGKQMRLIRPTFDCVRPMVCGTACRLLAVDRISVLFWCGQTGSVWTEPPEVVPCSTKSRVGGGSWGAAKQTEHSERDRPGQSILEMQLLSPVGVQTPRYRHEAQQIPPLRHQWHLERGDLANPSPPSLVLSCQVELWGQFINWAPPRSPVQCTP